MYDKEKDLIDAYIRGSVSRRGMIRGLGALGLSTAAGSILLNASATRALAADFDWKAHAGKTVKLLLNKRLLLLNLVAQLPQMSKYRHLLGKMSLSDWMKLKRLNTIEIKGWVLRYILASSAATPPQLTYQRQQLRAPLTPHSPLQNIQPRMNLLAWQTPIVSPKLLLQNMICIHLGSQRLMKLLSIAGRWKRLRLPLMNV